MNDYRIFFDEVIHTHIQIEQWFAGVAPEGTLPSLLARFSPEFSMVAPATGARVNAAGVNALFTRLGGMRPGLKITLSEMTGIDQHANGATVTYRELQIDDSGTRTDRRATVVFEKQASGALLWRHLHETYCQA
ncbi:DUF4440 domain-containing protein [Pseudomonas sp. R11F]|uniref:DUF4440 domain-containing protein n=1 Tax=Pseudomonas palleroniana TaxID=191390 RepID=A0A1H5I9R4_9PSED|nr:MULTISPECIES: hypothetical protein [Pseudomonas]AVE07272.1 DUF4440 domain-containing protein [Pseudomonas palleroniana]KAB0567196.1 DUF4440 domain-containing protein [Pseudomonas palleroniana]KWU51325.1 hypothetical protein AWV77_08795 [Pseudomonas palleroniana]MBI6906877.1 DUF4440 domain-containing protein [Pseudomonas palleroniana]MBM9487189.1 DUF4440 domain-containing protein [Pseudomonas sp. ICBG1301]